MKRKLNKLLLLNALLFSLSSCLSLPQNTGSDELASDETTSEDVVPEDQADEFADFEGEASPDAAAAPTEAAPIEDPAAIAAADPAPAPEQAPAVTDDDEFNLDDSSQPPAVADNNAATDELTLDEPTPEAVPPVATNNDDLELSLDDVPADPAPAAPSNDIATTIPEPTPEPAPLPEPSSAGVDIAAPVSSIPENEIKAVQFKTHENGGSLIIQGEKPLTFSTRKNPETHQLILEINNARLPDRFKRPLNMRDMKGSIGAVDAYQDSGSSMARFVVQMRNGSSQPFVIAEGNTLLVIADTPPQVAASLQVDGVQKDLSKVDVTVDPTGERILTSRTLQEFLAGNTKFYGKKVSLETNSMPVREALRFISEEGGVNMIIADNIQGNVSLKLRDVPWDQAFIVIMKSKDLGYVRQGNVLRVAAIADLRKEEEDAISLTTARLRVEPLVVKVFPINFAKVDDLSARIKDFLTERGRVAGDARTNSIVVTDIQQNLDRVSQLIQSLDTQPPQVLIEGRIIEATDEFQRQIGINWSFGGGQYILGKSNQGSITMRPSLGISTGTSTGSILSLQVGAFDILGDINAFISLNELENKIRVLSSPRIVTLSNEKAAITQKIQIPVATSTQNAGGPPSISYSFKDVQLKLDVTPQITSNASVIMSINVLREIPGVATAGSDQISIESREASTKVMVKNGQTSIIGGVYQNDTTETISGVPILKDIPLLGSLFRSKNNRNRRTELMIFLTPRIVAAGQSGADDGLQPVLGRVINPDGGPTNAVK